MKIQLNKTQKIALSRVLYDLIEADSFIKEKEMDFFENLVSKKELNISETMLLEARKMNLAKAVSILKELNENRRLQIIKCLKELALSDGTCVPLEAILIFALEQSMKHNACIYSIPAKDLGIDNMEVIYIENDAKTEIAKAIEVNYRYISNEFLLAGFDFVYIPYLINDFKRMTNNYLEKVVKYMIPSIPKENVERICSDLQSMTTSRFCRDLLYKKKDIPLLNISPSLLIKIGESSVIGQYSQAGAERTYMANFLRIELTEDIQAEIQRLIESYHSMINSPIVVISMPKNRKFSYSGFHRSLFDLVAYEKEERDYRLCFDISGHKGSVYFEPVDGIGERIAVEKLHPQQIALFVMIAKKSISGPGLDWREKIPEDQKKERRKLLTEYNKIYSRIGKGKTTCDYKDSVQVSRLKKVIKAIKNVANKNMFEPKNKKEGAYSYYLITAEEKYLKIIE